VIFHFELILIVTLHFQFFRYIAESGKSLSLSEDSKNTTTAQCEAHGSLSVQYDRCIQTRVVHGLG